MFLSRLMKGNCLFSDKPRKSERMHEATLVIHQENVGTSIEGIRGSDTNADGDRKLLVVGFTRNGNANGQLGLMTAQPLNYIKTDFRRYCEWLHIRRSALCTLASTNRKSVSLPTVQKEDYKLL